MIYWTALAAGRIIRQIQNNNMRKCGILAFGLVAMFFGACASAPKPIPTPPPTINETPIAKPDPDPIKPTPPSVRPLPTPPTPPPPKVEVYEFQSGFNTLAYWQNTDPSAALKSFKKTCLVWTRRKDGDWLNPNLPQYGQIKDWRSSCQAAQQMAPGRTNAVAFFQTHFEPVSLRTQDHKDGLLTAYYAPEIGARRQADSTYSEPILARPASKQTQHLPRKDINARSSKVLAYGRPIDVFFLQVQGSGRIKFPGGMNYVAAFDGHNNQPYKSIGKALIARGDLPKNKASKQDIEDWMARVGPAKTRALINENPRYIFFKTEYVRDGIGPKGAMGAPLTDMGSLAVDPRYHPYGSLVWLETKLPSRPGDYRGVNTGLLVSAQDTGGAIKGPMRGDLYYGAGDEAGAKAGVMKHRAVWTIFLPSALAVRALTVS